MLRKAGTELLTVFLAAPPCWKNPHSILSLKLKKKKKCKIIFPSWPSEFVSKNSIGPIIRIALTAHTAPNLIAYNGTSRRVY